MQTIADFYLLDDDDYDIVCQHVQHVFVGSSIL